MREHSEVCGVQREKASAERLKRLTTFSVFCDTLRTLQKEKHPLIFPLIVTVRHHDVISHHCMSLINMSAH